MPVVAPARIVGTDEIAAIFGVTVHHVRHNVTGRFAVGYIGKIAGRHCWNLSAVMAAVFTPTQIDDMLVAIETGAKPAVCQVDGCGDEVVSAALCKKHLRRFLSAWDQAGKSRLRAVQLVAMARWIVEHNPNVRLPDGFDPFSNVCMTPGCGAPIQTDRDRGWQGPLCRPCVREFYSSTPSRAQPDHWRRDRPRHRERFDPDGDQAA